MSHVHGPDCGCHDHAHDHEHENHHHHEHGPDCACGCHGHTHSEAEELVEGALRYSRKDTVTLPAPVPAGELEARIGGLLMQAAERLAESGFVLGHIKALLQTDADSVSLSITRLDHIDRTVVGGWEPSAPTGTYTLTVNILSLIHTDAELGDLIAALYAAA